jgi:hypothetical protein
MSLACLPFKTFWADGRQPESYLSDYQAVKSASSIEIPATTPRNRSQITRQQSAGRVGHKTQNQLVGDQSAHQPLGILEIMLTPPWSTVGERLRQVLTHMGLQFQPHRPPVLSSRFHHRLFYSLFPQPHQQAVQLAWHGDESPPRWFLFRRTRVHDNYHQNFLVYVNPRHLHRFLLAWKRQNAREKGYTPSRATTPPIRRGGATQIGSTRAFPIKLRNGLASSRV